MLRIFVKYLFLFSFLISSGARADLEKRSRESSDDDFGPWSAGEAFLWPDPESISFLDAHRAIQSKHEVLAGVFSLRSKSEDINPGQSKITEDFFLAGYRASFFTKALDPWQVVRVGAAFISAEEKSKTRVGQLTVFETEPRAYSTIDSKGKSSRTSFSASFRFPFGFAAATTLASVDQTASLTAEGEPEQELKSKYSRPVTSIAWATAGHIAAIEWQPSVIIEDDSGPVMQERKVSFVYHYLLHQSNLGLGLTHHGWKELDEQYSDKVSYTLTSEQRAGRRAMIALEGTYSPAFYTTFGSLDPVTMPRSSFGIRVDFSVAEHLQLILGASSVAKARQSIVERGFKFSAVHAEQEYSASLRGFF
jgi:hypothetical protein